MHHLIIFIFRWHLTIKAKNSLPKVTVSKLWIIWFGSNRFDNCATIKHRIFFQETIKLSPIWGNLFLGDLEWGISTRLDVESLPTFYGGPGIKMFAKKSVDSPQWLLNNIHLLFSRLSITHSRLIHWHTSALLLFPTLFLSFSAPLSLFHLT